MNARDLEALAWVLVGITIALLAVSLVTGSPLPVLPAVLATVAALVVGKVSDRERER